MSDFYEQNDYRNYLQHHGIKGMHWGEQNGPPYPLSTKVHNMVVRGREKRAAKRRSKIMHDPAKLYKHREEFSKEEIDAAVAKIQSANRAKELAPKKPKKPTMAEKRAAKKSEKKIRKYSSIKQLEKNSSKLTTDEISKALERIGKKQEIFDKKMKEADKPRKVVELGSNYIKTAVDTVRNITNLKKAMTKYDPNKLTNDEKHYKWLKEQGLFDFMSTNQIKSYTEATKIKDNETIKKQKEVIDKYKDIVKEQEEKLNKLSNVERAQAAKEYADEFAESWGNTTVTEAALTKVDNIADSLVNDYNYMLQMGYEDPNRVYHSDLLSDILLTSFSDISSIIDKEVIK